MGFFLLGCERKQSQGEILPTDGRRSKTACARNQPLASDGTRHRLGNGRNGRCAMSWLKFVRRKRSDAELQDEIETFLSEEMSDNMARGMSPEEARRQARVKLGNPQK